MTLTLATAATLRAKAGANSAITYTLHGDAIAAGADAFQTLGQGQLTTSVATIYTVPASTQALVKAISLANMTASPVTGVTFYINGATDPFAINGGFTIPANGSAVFANGLWQVYDSAGALVGTTAITLTGDVTGSGFSPLATTIANDAVTYAKMQNVVANNRVLGRVSGAGGDVEELTGTQATAVLDAATTALKGLMSAADKKKADGAFKDIVADFGADPTGATDCTALIQTAVDSFGAAGGRLYFPAGTYKVDLSSASTITISKPVILVGAGRAISNISVTHATKTVFTMASGAQGAGFEQIRISGSAAGTRTAGHMVDFGSIANVYMQQCDIIYCWSGVHSGGALQFLDDMNIREVSQNAASGQAVLVDSTGDRYIRRLTTDSGASISTAAGIRIKECSSCVISDCNIIHAGTCVELSPNAGAGHQVASVWVIQSFLDTSHTGFSAIPATNNDSINRVRLIGCWLSTMSVNGATLGSASINVANTNSVDFIGCEIYQNVVGIDSLGVAEWSVRASRLAQNSTAAIRTAAGAQASVHAFSISDNVIGAVAGFTANGIGINIQSGTYKRYQILDNRGLETNTTKGITDAGTVAAADQKRVDNNMGHDSTPATIGADVSFTTTELILCQVRVPAGTRVIGETWNIRMTGTGPAAAGNFTFKVRVGPLGTATGDPAAYTSAATAGVITGRHGVDLQAVMKTATSVRVEGQCFSNAAVFSPAAGAAPAATAVTTTADWFITLTGIMSASTSIATAGSITKA